MIGNLFCLGQFLLHSGEVSNFKIDCEALTDGDWRTIAEIIRERVPVFSSVLGVPRGGMPLQAALEGYGTGKMTDPLLIVDDVYTTGKSLRDTLAQVKASGWTGPVFGVVLFCRNPIQEHWVHALWRFDLHEPFATTEWDPRAKFSWDEACRTRSNY